MGYNEECPEATHLNFHLDSEFSDFNVNQTKIQT